MGRFIVFEGTDGAGKTTQFNLLCDYFAQHNLPYAAIDFPQYRRSFHGQLVARYLNGEFGDVWKVDPHLIALAYAGDRLEAKPQIESWLAEGKWVLANRYTGANMAYMSAKLPPEQRPQFITWLQELEYAINRIPHEDIVLFFNVPLEIAQDLIAKKGKRDYTTASHDIHERDLAYLREVEQQFFYLVETDPRWVCVTCTAAEQIRPVAEIHKDVVQLLQERGIIPRE